MAETSKCITVSIEEPQITIEKVYVLRDGTETTTIYKNESLSRYDFAVRATVSGGTVYSPTFRLIVNNVEVASYKYVSDLSTAFTYVWCGGELAELKGWSTIGDMLNAVGAGSKTSVDICHKIEW